MHTSNGANSVLAITQFCNTRSGPGVARHIQAFLGGGLATVRLSLPFFTPYTSEVLPLWLRVQCYLGTLVLEKGVALSVTEALSQLRLHIGWGWTVIDAGLAMKTSGDLKQQPSCSPSCIRATTWDCLGGLRWPYEGGYVGGSPIWQEVATSGLWYIVHWSHPLQGQRGLWEILESWGRLSRLCPSFQLVLARGGAWSHEVGHCSTNGLDQD